MTAGGLLRVSAFMAVADVVRGLLHVVAFIAMDELLVLEAFMALRGRGVKRFM